jgi:hypothetical protein
MVDEGLKPEFEDPKISNIMNQIFPIVVLLSGGVGVYMYRRIKAIRTMNIAMKRQLSEYLGSGIAEEHVGSNPNHSADLLICELLNDYRLSEMLDREENFASPVQSQK